MKRNDMVAKVNAVFETHLGADYLSNYSNLELKHLVEDGEHTLLCDTVNAIYQDWLKSKHYKKAHPIIYKANDFYDRWYSLINNIRNIVE